MIAPPLAVACALAGVALVSSWSHGQQASRAAALAKAAGRSGELIELLRREEAAAAGVLVGRSGADTDFVQARAATDTGVQAFTRARRGLGAEERLRAVDAGVAGLARLRDQVSSRRVALSAAAVQYRIVASDLVEFRDAVALAGGIGPDTAVRVRAAALLSRAREAVAEQEVLVLRAVSAGSVTGRAAQELTRARAVYQQALDGFADSARPQWRSWLALALADPAAVAAVRWEDEAARTPVGAAMRIDPAAWARAMGARAGVLRSVEARVDDAVAAEIDDARASQWRSTVGLSVVLFTTLAVTALVGAVLGRRLAGRVRDLRDATQDFTQQLPELLRRARVDVGRSPESVGAALTPTPEPRGGDEVADLTREFAKTQQAVLVEAAAGAAAEQQHRETLMALARRLLRGSAQSQRLIDQAQSGEGDAEKLEQLFRIDHAVSGAARLADNVLLIGGGQSGRVPSDTPLVTIVRVALGRITSFERIQAIHVADIPPELVVTGPAVHVLVQALVELIDNAASFSTASVLVHASARSSGVDVVVDDAGIGIPDRLVGWCLTGSTPVEQTDVTHLGLTVVGHAARRLGLEVRWERRRDRVGTRVRIALPARLFVTGLPHADRAPAPEGARVPSARRPSPAGSPTPVRPTHDTSVDAAVPLSTSAGVLPRRVPGAARPAAARSTGNSTLLEPDVNRLANTAAAFRAATRRRTHPTPPPEKP